jgi:hypothetical protein
MSDDSYRESRWKNRQVKLLDDAINTDIFCLFVDYRILRAYQISNDHLSYLGRISVFTGAFESMREGGFTCLCEV